MCVPSVCVSGMSAMFYMVWVLQSSIQSERTSLLASDNYLCSANVARASVALLMQCSWLLANSHKSPGNVSGVLWVVRGD